METERAVQERETAHDRPCGVYTARVAAVLRKRSTFRRSLADLSE